MIDFVMFIALIVVIAGGWLVFAVFRATFSFSESDVVDEVEAEHRYIDAVNRL